MSDNDPFTDFDLNDPELPRRIKQKAMQSGGYPYEKKLDKDTYWDELGALHRELVKLQASIQESGERIAIVFEGRDAAGKGGTIKRFLEHLNPRTNRIVALPKPSDRERGEWYFQRYVSHLPSAGESALFDRSWYNRAGVEPVMGFSTPEQTQHFLSEAPRFEQMLVDDGIHFFKFWLDMGREMQIKRFHDRRHDPLKVWKLSPIDLKALGQWDEYTAARDAMLEATDTPYAPWTVIRANDKRRLRLNVMRTVLLQLDYKDKDLKAIGEIDPQIVLSVKQYLAL